MYSYEDRLKAVKLDAFPVDKTHLIMSFSLYCVDNKKSQYENNYFLLDVFF